jgi:predicted Ser/Thr protein kinase
MLGRIGTLPSRYRNVERIGAGGMGEVYRATDDELGRDVAVKVLAERFAENDALRARFKREALAAARLSAIANVVTVFDVGEHDGRPHIVMEYLPGGSLDDRIAPGSPVDPEGALGWLDEAAAALDGAHAAGIVHRDVKPGNLLLDGRDHVHIADFGVASAAHLESFTQTGTILGTAGYLSPEQASGRRATAASDPYALGVVAWQLLVGMRPFEAQTATAEAAAHVNQPVPSAHAANPALPAAVDAVFERALAKDPAARYPTATTFVDALRHALEAGPADAGWPTPRLVATDATRILPRPQGRRRWLPVLALLVLLAAGATAAVLATRGDRTRTLVRTVTRPGTTRPGTTLERTVTIRATTTSTPATPSQPSGAQLNNEGYAKMQAGDFGGALPLLEQAVQKLDGSGQIDEAYAKYNLAYTRFQLGDCDGVLDLLDAAQSIEGHRKEIDRLRKQAGQRCASRGKGQGNGQGD